MDLRLDLSRVEPGSLVESGDPLLVAAQYCPLSSPWIFVSVLGRLPLWLVCFVTRPKGHGGQLAGGIAGDFPPLVPWRLALGGGGPALLLLKLIPDGLLTAEV